MLDKVKNELCRSKSIEKTVLNFLSMSKIDIIPFPSSREIIIAYAKLSKQFGEGESACMAVARYQHQYIASSNLKDISKYCQEHKIVYLTTMDILCHAYDNKMLTGKECDDFITEVKGKGSILPCSSMKEFLAKRDPKLKRIISCQ
jgi:hypothetical protein